jgi:hypothetical protein
MVAGGAAGDPVGTWTVLFTDQVGSTAMRVRVGEEVFDRIRVDLDARLNAALAAHGVGVTTSTGDGVMAGFTSTAAALQCAVAIQRAVALRNGTTRVPGNSTSMSTQPPFQLEVGDTNADSGTGDLAPGDYVLYCDVAGRRETSVFRRRSSSRRPMAARPRACTRCRSDRRRSGRRESEPSLASPQSAGSEGRCLTEAALSDDQSVVATVGETRPSLVNRLRLSR